MSMTFCQHCNAQFAVTENDRTFYAHLDVPPPTLCPDCRQQRRLVWRNERKMYQRKCDMCKKDIISLYSSDKPFVVYCIECWWSDRWDQFSYGIAPDYSRPLFDQLKELQLQVPRPAMHGANNTNAEYCSQCTYCKNCYLVSGSDYSEDCYYSTNIQRSRNCFDCMFIFDCELCFECLDTNSSYASGYLQNCEGCSDSLFLFDCKNCSNCAMSANLRGAQYMFENKQETKESYEKKLAELRVRLHAATDAVRKEYERIKTQKPVRWAFVVGSEQSTGEYIMRCKNAQNCFDGEKLEDGRYISYAMDVKDSYDITCIGFHSERLYEGMSGVELNKVIFFDACFYSSYCAYCILTYNSTECFGCVGMKRGEYCILNKQYAKKEYEQERKKIIAHMKANGEWGEYFPMRIAPFAYNETPAQEYFPLDKEQAEALEARWQEASAGVYGKETIAWADVPLDISHAPDTFANEIVACTSCKKNYKIIRQALKFYKKMNLAIPKKCPDCRHLERLALRNPRALWHRQCMCEQSSHDHIGRCAAQFETAYAPDRVERVYCEQCYIREVV